MRRDSRAVLLTGTPGIGKTTIVKTVGAALSDGRIRGFVTADIRRACRGRHHRRQLRRGTRERERNRGLAPAGDH
jgi:nucleoside-triphosphatase THEP1